MRIDRDTYEEILATITRNKTRSVLTAFSVFWGIFLLTVLLGGGHGLQAMMNAQFEGFATNSGFIASQQTGEAYKGFRKGRWWSLEIQDVERLRFAVDGLDIISPVYSSWGISAVYGDKKYDCMVKGLYPDYASIEQPQMSYGRFINDVDLREARKVCVIGKRVYEQLFPFGGDPCGEYIRVNGIYYRIVGVNVSEGNININGPASQSIILPFTTMSQTFHSGRNVDIICITAKKGLRITDVLPEVERVVKEAHFVAPHDKQALMTLNMESMFSMVENLFTGIDILILMVGLGTLLAGVIGVSNIMMVTVRERTMEIGIRRAIGAKPFDILQQILSESIVLTFIAGMSGITFAVLVLQAVEMGVAATGQVAQFQVSFGTAVGTCILLVTLGVFAGLAPAYRAMSVKPIDAIRDE